MNKDLAFEAAAWRAQCQEQQAQLDHMVEEVRLYNIYNPHNVRRREKRKVIKLKAQKAQTVAVLKALTDHSLIAYHYKNKCQTLVATECTSCGQ